MSCNGILIAEIYTIGIHFNKLVSLWGFNMVQLFVVSPTQLSITGTGPLVVTVEGVSGTSYTGDIAIDDISIFDGNCLQGLYCVNILHRLSNIVILIIDWLIML